MLPVLTVLTALVCILLTTVILIQNPKGGGIDSTFGGAQANQMLGAARQTDFIEKITWILGAVLFVLCIVTSMLVDSQAALQQSLQ
jgi:preprotein translocase subunit SecG